MISKFSYNPSLIRELEKYAEDKNSLLDIGCAIGLHCYPFYKYGLKKIVGIDIKNALDRNFYRFFLYFRNKKNKILKLDKSELNLFDEYLPDGDRYWSRIKPEEFKAFKKHFEFVIDPQKGNILNYELIENSFDMIILSNVLHFYTPSKQKLIIEKVKTGLKQNGIIYIAANQYEKYIKRFDDESRYIRLDENIVRYDDRQLPQQIRYLSTVENIKKITSSFSKLEKDITDEGRVSFELILRK